MDNIFHVFISSTFKDLIQERKITSAAVAKAGYVAEGMEIFPASSQNQMTFIEKIIDRCDYYILILGGKYGSMGADGVSYTEKEFRYALKKNVPILAFLHKDILKLPADRVETDKKNKKKLNDFKEEIMQSSMIDHWTNSDELATKALAALSQARSSHPGIGWIRASNAASEDILSEINELRKTNDELRENLKNLKPNIKINNMKLASLDASFEIKYTKQMYGYRATNTKLKLSWREILGIIGPSFRTPSNNHQLMKTLKNYINSDVLPNNNFDIINVSARSGETILMQFEALGLFVVGEYKVKSGTSLMFHKLTKIGVETMLEHNVIGE